MNSNKRLNLWIPLFKLFFTVLSLSCNNYIIERSASDYFPIAEGNWWRYANEDLYNPRIIDVTVESIDTVLQTECYPFNFSGEFHYFLKDEKGIQEYIKIVQNYAGNEYTITEGFIRRLELPLVRGNQFRDSLVDSLEFFGEWIKARYVINGLVSDYEDDKTYGSVYRVIINTSMSVLMPDSSVVSEQYLEEYYAPGIGLIGFKNQQGNFRILEYGVH